jgi:tetratricopeptide (TPR) repeat protein
MQRRILDFAVVVLGCLCMPANLNAQTADAYNTQGVDWQNKGQYDKAIASYDQALTINPKYADAYNNRGLAWAKKGDYDKAIADFGRSLAIDSKEAVAYYNRGEVWEDKGDYRKAIADYTQSLAINPKYAHACIDRGVAWAKMGEYAKAIADYNQALAIDPKDAKAYNNLAWLYATCPDKAYRDGKKAFDNASKAYLLDYAVHWYSFGTLAAAYAENGDFDAAKQWEGKAIELAPDAESKQECRSHLALYNLGKPYHEDAKKP